MLTTFNRDSTLDANQARDISPIIGQIAFLGGTETRGFPGFLYTGTSKND